MNSYTYTTSTPTNASVGTALAVILIGWVLVIALVGLPSIITSWKLFTKAGRPGWGIIVPIYNYIVMLDIAKLPIWYLIFAFIPFLNVVLAVIMLVNFAKQYNAGVGFWLAYLFLPIVAVFMVGRVQYTGGMTITPMTGATPPTPPAGPSSPFVSPNVPPVLPQAQSVAGGSTPPLPEPFSAPVPPSVATPVAPDHGTATMVAAPAPVETGQTVTAPTVVMMPPSPVITPTAGTSTPPPVEQSPPTS